MTSGTSGPLSSTTSASSALQLSLVSRLQAVTQNLGSTLYTLTWKPWVMPSGLSRFRLRASVRRTSETVLSGWVTPTTRDWKDTPGMTAQREGKERNDQLPRQAYLCGWPTPTATDSRRVPSYDFTTPNVTLNHAAVLAGWATPRSADKHKGAHRAADQAVKGTDLPTMVTWTEAGPARLVACGEILTGSLAEIVNGGQLNPAHPRWLMGCPSAWDSSAPGNSDWLRWQALMQQVCDARRSTASAA